MLKIHEITTTTGELAGIYLRASGTTLEVVDHDGASPLPPGALEKVLQRFGAPFDPAARIIVVAELELGGGGRLRHVKHLAGYDVVMRDYLVLDNVERESLCAPGATVASALRHLARAAAARRSRAGD